ncbi:MAG: ribulokinase [Planctomycetes bacterium]|nr:ribulokinase [Planctomycetota bacterium]
MPSVAPLALGLDFGTESVRALLVDLKGNERGSAVARFRHGQIVEELPGSGERLPADFALQHPQDWIDASARAVRSAMRRAKIDAKRVISVGVDFTSCTMLPTQSDGTPLCQTKQFAREKFAWPKLWKHHGAARQTERMNALARRRKEKWLDRYRGIIGLACLFPKLLETVDEAPSVYDAADVWLEAGDWFVWQLVGGGARSLPRSTCQAGYKALWNAEDGYPSPAFFKALDKRMTHVVRDKMPGRMLAPGEAAGELSPEMAKRLGLRASIAISAAVIDAHAGVPGAGVAEAGTLVMVLGTSSCHMLNAECDAIIPGVAGVVEGGILPGMFGIETGQAAVGDGFDWLRRLSGQRDFKQLDRLAAELPPGADGVLCLDWLNGCRTPLMDGSLRGALTGLSLAHRPEHLYRAMIEASAFGVRWIVDLLQQGGVPVKRLVATGGLPHHNPLLVQIYADVLGKQILVHPSEQGPALGAAILGVLAAGRRTTGFSSAAAAIRAMASRSPTDSACTSIPTAPSAASRSRCFASHILDR